MRRYRRFAALALAAGTVALAALTFPLRASANGPSAPSLPDFTGGVPYQESEPSPWAFDVVTGGLNGGDTVTFRFDYNHASPDHLHAVSFANLTPNRQGVSIVDYPADVVRPTGCQNPSGFTSGSTYPHSLADDPYGQTITLVVDPPGFQAGHLLQFCFSGGIGFPVIPDPNSDYGITYTEPGGRPPVRAAYNVSAQSTATHQIHLNDADGYEMTNGGIGGGRLAVYGATYSVSLHGAPSATYAYTTGYQSAAHLNIVFGSSATTGVGPTTCPNPPPPPGQVSGGIFCTDTSGNVTGILRISSDQPDLTVYVVFTGLQSGAATTQSTATLISLTIGPANASPPKPVTTPTPTASASGSGLPSPFDAKCITPYLGNSGLGSLEIYEANTVAISRAFDKECPGISGLVSYAGVNDTVALTQLVGVLGSPYAFAGLDRPLTHQEWANCSTQQGPPCKNGAVSSNVGVMQWPIFLQPLVITYNLPTDSSLCQTATVQMSSRLLSAIFTGAVTHWNDSLVTAENPSLSSCNLPILVAHDEGVASAVLKDYLSKQNPQWNAFKDPAAADSWPATAPSSCMANGSDAMALCVLGRPGTIGYGFYHAIHRAGLPYAAISQPNGGASPSVGPSPSAGAPPSYFTGSPVDGCTTAAATYPALADTSASGQNPLPQSDWSSISLTDWAQGYPICAFNFLVTPSTICRNVNVHDHRGFLAYMGSVISAYTQKKLAEQGYAPLPTNVLGIDNAGLSSLQTSDGCHQ